MKCDYCDSKATVFLTQLSDGQMKKVCLCEPCAEERGVTDPTGFLMADMLLDGGPQSALGQTVPIPVSSSATSNKSCPTCGFTLDDLKRVRRFGCADCYEAFGEEVSHMLRSMHKGTTHVGKVPEGLMAMQVKHQRLKELQGRLEEAIASESYEEAARIRDDISKLNDDEL